MVTSSYDTVGGDLPLPLGGGQVAASGELSSEFDVFVGGLSLNLHITRDQPYRRETAQWQKQQIDLAPEAGEQTLSDWWVRSQMSFHGGAGVTYLDTLAQDQSANRIRFDDSRGIDVWTQGEFKRLPDTELQAATSGKTWVFSTTLDTESYVIYGFGTTIKADRTVAGDTITYTVTGMTGAIKSMVIDGSHYYVATGDGHVFRGPIDNSSAGVAIWDFDSSSDVTLGWCKQRLMAGIDHQAFELAGVGPTLPDALYTHPSEGFRFTAWSEAPDAVLGGGASGLNSAIFAFTITDASGAPELTPGVAIAELPVGETLQALYLYVGSKLAIGTSAGLRVGAFDSAFGSFAYGPLSCEIPVTAITGRGSFVYCGAQVDGESSLLRVDLGTPVEDGPIYAWAPDLRGPSSTVTGKVNTLTVGPDGLIRFAVQGYGVVREGTTFAGREAWLRTSRLRFATVEGKRFKYGRVRAEGVGTFTVSAETPEQQRNAFAGTAGQAAAGERFSLVDGDAEWVQLTFTLTNTTKITSYQVLALPAQPRSRLFSLPVALFDKEQNRHGRTIGYPGRAKELLDRLETTESSGDEVTVQCPALGIDAARCVIERIEFMQTSPPTASKSYGLGGYANLVFRTLT